MNVGNPLEHLPEAELVRQHSNRPADNHFLTEMLRRHMTTSQNLGDKIWWLNLWLLVATLAILTLTGVLVWHALRWSGR